MGGVFKRYLKNSKVYIISMLKSAKQTLTDMCYMDEDINTNELSRLGGVITSVILDTNLKKVSSEMRYNQTELILYTKSISELITSLDVATDSLLSYQPVEYQLIRRSISLNNYFTINHRVIEDTELLNLLQAFSYVVDLYRGVEESAGTPDPFSNKQVVLTQVKPLIDDIETLVDWLK